MPITEDDKYKEKYGLVSGNLTKEDLDHWAKAVNSLTPEELEMFNKELKRRSRKQ
jgi:hypothetical protein